MTPSIRIATFNIHSAYGDARREAARLIAASGADVVALQECSQSSADGICGHLGLDWRAHVAPAAWHLSNAVLSRLPFERGPTLTLRTRHAEPRSAVMIHASAPNSRTLHVCSTHLDHLDEPTRLMQWDQLHDRLPDDCVVCGDFNALRRDDYSAEAWTRIALVRRRNDWEAPTDELTQRILRQGFRDAAEQAGGDRAATCRFDTRVDFIWLAPRFRGDAVPGSYRRLPARQLRISDHDLVLVDVDVGAPSDEQR